MRGKVARLRHSAAPARAHNHRVENRRQAADQNKTSAAATGFATPAPSLPMDWKAPLHRRRSNIPNRRAATDTLPPVLLRLPKTARSILGIPADKRDSGEAFLRRHE